MESALGAASHFHSGHLTPGSLRKFSQPGDILTNQIEIPHKRNTPNANSSSAHNTLANKHYPQLCGDHNEQANLMRSPPTRIRPM